MTMMLQMKKDRFDKAFDLFMSRLEEVERELVDPVPYLEQFRPLNQDELKCIATSCLRGRIPLSDPLMRSLNDFGCSNLVSYSCNAQGVTTCVILCRAADNTYLFTGVSRLNPVDSYDRKEGEAKAFYRAVVESEALILPAELSFALAV